LKGVEWADIDALGSRVLGGTDTIAQVHPNKLCNAMWDYSQDAVGSKLVTGKIVEAISDDDGSIQGVKLDDGTAIVAEALVVACGPWTHVARTWFGSDVGNRIPRMNGIKVIGRVALEGVIPCSLLISRALFHFESR